MKIRFKKKPIVQKRRPQPDINRTSAYHYSAHRSKVDQSLDRQTEQGQTNKKRRSESISHYVMIVGGVLIISICGLYLASLSTQPIISGSNENQTGKNTSQYQNEIQAILSSSPSNRTKVTISAEKVSEELLQKYPEFTEVSVSTPIIRHRPVVKVTFAQPAVVLSTGTERYLLDTRGRVLQKIDSNIPETLTNTLPLVLDKTGTQIKIGKPALTTAQVAYIGELIAQAENKNIKIDKFELKAGGGELDAWYIGFSYFVKYNFFENARSSTGTFFATKERLELENKPPAEYIDVRVPERAYVK